MILGEEDNSPVSRDVSGVALLVNGFHCGYGLLVLNVRMVVGSKPEI
jgi:hypothetical protein